MKTLDIIRQDIFKNKVISGVIEANISEDRPNGFSTKYNEFVLKETISHNREELNSLYPSFKFIYQNQYHSDKIINIDNNYLNKNIELDSDAIITNLNNIMLCVHIADCGALLLYDKINHSIAAIHSGWQGSKKNIAGKTILKMKKNFNTSPKNLLAYLSPCASIDNYEVGKEFIEYFPNSIRKYNGKYYFNNKKEIKSQLLISGLIETNIELSELCTITSNNLHSYRRDNNKSGRMTAFIGLL